MLRPCFVRHSFNLADAAREAALPNSIAPLRGLRSGPRACPATQMKLRRLLARRVDGDGAHASQKTLSESKAPLARDFPTGG